MAWRILLAYTLVAFTNLSNKDVGLALSLTIFFLRTFLVVVAPQLGQYGLHSPLQVLHAAKYLGSVNSDTSSSFAGDVDFCSHQSCPVH